MKFKAFQKREAYRRWRHTEDNMFMLERLIEMVNGRKEEIFVAFLDMEKTYLFYCKIIHISEIWYTT